MMMTLSPGSTTTTSAFVETVNRQTDSSVQINVDRMAELLVFGHEWGVG
jgi:hypothetical protein